MGTKNNTFQFNLPMLRKVREHLGFSLREACRTIPPTKEYHSPEARLAAWEDGREAPTFNQIKDLFEKIYRYPSLVLQLNDLPADNPQIVEYRKDNTPLPASKKRELRVFENEIVSRQTLLRDIAEEENWPTLEFIGSLNLETPIEKASSKIRDLLDYEKVKHEKDLFKALRTQIENIGIFVFQQSNIGRSSNKGTKVDFSGLALSDKKVPVICINSGHTDARKQFTLIHELVHILLFNSSISIDKDSDDDSEKIERFCDQIASDFFLSQQELDRYYDENKSLEDNIKYIQSKSRLSRMAVIFRLYHAGYISYNQYKELWILHDQRPEKKAGGIDPVIIARSRLGKKYINAIAQAYSLQYISWTSAKKALGGMTPESLERAL